MVISDKPAIKGYELLGTIGEGAYGVVYRARQPFVDRDVAFKVILPEFANLPDFIRRFETEAQLVAQLEHLHIVPLYDYWRDPEGAYLVMRLMKGGNMANALQDGPLELPYLAKVVDQITSALAAAHQQGVVHRDLKPANILLDEDGNAYLSDFGIAKALGIESGLTLTGAILGTPAYISPEQVQSLALSPQTDIYALGVVLYELLAGEHPFPETTTGELVIKHVNEPLPLLRVSRPNLPAQINQVIQKATAKDPQARYADTLSLASDFRRALKLEVALPVAPEGELYNPYKGLQAFQETDAEDFFGREGLTAEIIDLLKEDGEFSRFLAVVGPSGSGKSSVVKAGLIPALRTGALPGSDQWFIIEMTPGAHPFEELELALLRIAVKEQLSLLEQLQNDPRGLLRVVRRLVPEGSELLLVVDQLEEVFTLVEQPDQASLFLQSLYEVVVDPRSPMRVVATLRADFYDRPLMHPNFSSLMKQRTIVVVPLTTAELEEAIRAPAERVGAVLEKGLVPSIIEDVIDQPGALPLLQYALTELFDQRQGRMLTNQTYQSIGGVLGVLGGRAENIFSGLDQAGKAAARQLFLRLVALGEGVEDTRRRVLRREIETLPVEMSGVETQHVASLQVMGDVIDTFGDGRLLTFDHDPQTRGSTVEVAHEALLKEWPRLQTWLDESRGDIRMQRILSNAAAEWLGANQEASFLLRGSRLVQFEDWAKGSAMAMTHAERSYLETSLDSRQEEETAEAMRREREQRQISIGLASQAMLELEGSSPDRALPLALEALEKYPYTKQAESALGQAVLRCRLRLRLEHEDRIQTAFWSSDGTRILTSSMDQSARVWDAITGEELNRICGGLPNMASWSPDEKSILALSETTEDQLVKVWDTECGKERFTLNLEEIGGKLNVIPNDWRPWSPSGDSFFLYNIDGNLRIFDSHTGAVTQELSGHVGKTHEEFEITISNARWSPNGDLVAVSSFGDNTTIIYQVITGEPLYTLPGEYENERLHFGRWSPSGESFVTRGMGGARVYDSASGEQIHYLSTPGVYCFHAIWSPDGARLLTSGVEDGIARLWDAESGQELDRLISLDHARALDWSPNGELTAVAGDDAYIHVWELAKSREIIRLSGSQMIITEVAFSPDGNQLFAKSMAHKTLQIYNLMEARLNISIPTPSREMTNVAWSPSGNHIAFNFFEDGTPKVWDANSGEEIFTLSGHEGLHNYISWSPSGDRIATGSFDKTAKIWDASTGDLLLTLRGHDDAVYCLYWNPDGSRIASGGRDGKVIIWDSTAGEEILTFSDHEKLVWHAVWSPDGTRILSCEENSKALIWDPATGEVLLDLYPEDYRLAIGAAAWTKDGKQVFLQSIDGLVCKFDSRTGDLLSEFTAPPYAWHLSLSPTGERILIGSLESTATIFDAKTGAELFCYEVGGGLVDAQYSPDGDWVLIGTYAGDLKILPTWHSAQELIDYVKDKCSIRQLTAKEREQYGLPPI